jgi:serine/threonine protein kinase
MSSQVPIVNLRPLNAGGNGDVFVGQRSDTGQEIVVKVLREFHAPHARKSFAREVRILAQKINGLVPLLHSCIDGERPYYVMPYFVRGPLTRYVGILPPENINAVAMSLATTLAGLHARNISHGDFKPDNIFVSNDGNLQVGDPLGNGFGCTVLFSQNHGGTPGYWAPEVKAGGSISNAGDVFSYAVTLYHLLTGVKPQDGQRFDQLSLWYPGLPKICEIIAVCTQSDPGARPNMNEVISMLKGAAWIDIQASRKQVQGLVTFAALGGALVLFLRMFAKK